MKIKAENEIHIQVGFNIKRIRQERKMNQLILANKVKLSRTSLVNIEQGKQSPSLLLLVKLAELFQVSLHDLIPKNVNVEISTNRKKAIPLKNESVLEFIETLENFKFN
jgi:DNA-binding XRE family transcriptional regulator